MKKKILAIDQGEHLGGAERFLSELLTRIGDRYQVGLLTGKNADYHRLYEGSQVEIIPVSIPRLKPMSVKSLTEYRRTQDALRKKIQEYSPDLILSNTVRTHLLISPLAKEYHIPLVWMAHDLTFPGTLLRWFIGYPQAIVSCSRFVEAAYHSPAKKKSLQNHVLYPFGIDPKHLDRLKKVKREKIIGMVGNFIPWKGQEIFIRMAHELHSRHPEYRFVIIGQSYKGNKESEIFQVDCLRLIDELGMTQALQVKANVTDVMKEMATWEVAVHCSTDPEPLGRVILEGMTAGCAVIASRLGGPSEIIQDQQTGLLIDPNQENLVQAVSQYIQHHDIREKIADQGRQFIEREFLWKTQIEKFESTVLQCLENGGRSWT